MYTLENAELLAGISTSGAEEGQKVEILQKAFLTPEKGFIFYKALEGFEKIYLRPHLQNKKVSSIDHFLILVDKNNKTANVYVNELEIISKCILKRSVEKGEAIYKKDIAGITKLEFENVKIPSDNGIVFYFSVGWRKGLYFDFTPLHNESSLDGIESLLGELYQSFIFSELELLKDDEIVSLYQNGWFPFITILGELFEEIISAKTSNISLKNVEDKIFEYFNKREILMSFLEKYKKIDVMQSHIPFIERGIERFLEGDYISCISNIWPRIEGILRYLYTGEAEKPGQTKLLEYVESILNNNMLVPTLYFPSEFKEFMKLYYFKDFNIKDGHLEVTRHSLGHGVSEASSYDKKRALIGLLIVDQLFYYASISKKADA